MCWVMFIAVTYPSTISGNVNEQATFHSYNCSSNFICLGQARETPNTLDEIEDGRLSLISDYAKAGIAYYNDPVRLVNYSTGRSASFWSSFVVSVVSQSPDHLCPSDHGDGMAFIISADNQTLGGHGMSLGIFDVTADGHRTTSFKSIVVEFDGYQNPNAPAFDISDNHVSFDFSNITFAKAANASDVNVLLWSSNATIYAWVEYNNESSQLEARVSNNNSRPINPLLNYTVNLFDHVEEYMWVGFSAGSGDCYSGYYVGDWTFESNGVFVSNWTFHTDRSLPSDTNSSGTSSLLMIVEYYLIIVGYLGAPIFTCAVVSVFLRRFLHREAVHKWQSLEQENPLKQIDGMLERFSSHELSEATAGFSEESKLGEGGFGSVYRGLLPSSGIPVAVKKISSDSSQGEKEFMAEVSIINQSRHRNLLELLGWCTEGFKIASKRQYLLVYELMGNGSVDRWLFRPDEEDTTCLSWSLRFDIVEGTAAALEYLHHMCKRQVIHRDIKCSNIMLDKNFNAKLGDFGLSRLVDHQDAAPPASIVDGTHGSIASRASDRTENVTLFSWNPRLHCSRGTRFSQMHR